MLTLTFSTHTDDISLQCFVEKITILFFLQEGAVLCVSWNAGGPEARHSSTSAAEGIWTQVHGEENAGKLMCVDLDQFHRDDVATWM